MNSGRFCESEFWTAKVAMNRMSKGNTFYGRKALGMGLGTRDRTSNRTFSISVF